MTEWTTPRDWTTGEVVTEAQLDTHVRDNLLHLFERRAVVAKSADETVNNSNTVQNDDELLVALTANDTFVFEGVLFVSAGSDTPGIKVAFAVPSGASVKYASPYLSTVETNHFSADLTSWGAAISPGIGQGRGVDASGVGAIQFRGWVANGANAGNLQLQWAQETAHASDTKVREGSHLIVTKV